MALPAYRSLLVVDAVDFSRHRDVELPALHAEIRRSLAIAANNSGLGEEWQAVRFKQSTGDGLLAILPLEAMAKLIHPFTDRLQEVLAGFAPGLRVHDLQLRLRVALHIGPVDDEDPLTAGVSTATIEVCRLLDSDPIRAALRDSDPAVTYNAAVVSAEAFDTFVRGGHTTLRPSQFTRVQAKVKKFDRPAFLYVPTPSHRPDDEGAGGSGGSSAPDSTPPPSPAPGGISMGNITIGAGSQNAFGNQGGNVRQVRS